MDHLACKHHFSRVIPLLACCSLAWLAYSRYTVKQQPTQRALPVSKSVTDSDELPARATLDKLSLDILLEIMEYLEWHELLKLRQVSFSLNTATRERVLWHALIRSSPLRFGLTKAIQSCSSQELEDAFLRVWKVNQRWVNVNPEGGRPHIRQLDQLAWLSPHNCMILPGGRWLLKLEDDAGLFYTDLNSVDTQWRMLVAPHPLFKQPWGLPWAQIDHLVDIDNNAESLTFNVVILTMMHWTRDRGPMPSRFNVWRCSAAFDEHGYETGLTATLLSTFEEWDVGVDQPRVCLRGDFVAYTYLDAACYSRLIIVNWRDVHEQGNNFPRFIFPYAYEGIEDLIILPNKQLFYQSDDHLRPLDIVTWENMVPTTDPPTVNTPALLTAAHVILDTNPPPHSTRVSKYFVHDHGLTYFTYSRARNTISCCSLQFPGADSPSSLNMRVDNLYNPPQKACFSYGFTANRAILRLNDMGLATGTYCVDQERHVTSLNFFEWTNVLPSLSINGIILEEVTGRCLLRSEKGKAFLVDFAI